MRVAVTGATGMIGRQVVEELLRRGDEVTVLSRDAAKGRETFGGRVEAHAWRCPREEPAPAEALAGRDGVVNLLGEPLDQRWTDAAKREIRDSRVLGTRNLVAALQSLDEDSDRGAHAPRETLAARGRPSVLVSQSASGYYGSHGDEPVDESEAPGDDFLAGVCAEWEAEAARADALGMRVAITRTGVVLSAEGGALKEMMLPFKLGVGGPVAGGRQYVPWVHADDVAGAIAHCLESEAASGPINVTAPRPATNADLSKALGRALRRPAIMPVPALAVRALYGEMALTVTTGVRAVPKRLQALGYEFRRPELEPALRAAVG
ncbi:MAG: TIGR01777 family oxidoreductase [Thermoleophilaceae bacterium]